MFLFHLNKKMTFFSATPPPYTPQPVHGQDVRRGVLELRRSLTAAVDRLVRDAQEMPFPETGNV